MKHAALLFRLVRYFTRFMFELVKANIQVARLALSPGLKFQTAAIRHQSDVKTPAELLLLTNSITLTPGSLVMDANLETGEILIHLLAESAEESRKDIARFPEHYALRALRGDSR